MRPMNLDPEAGLTLDKVYMSAARIGALGFKIVQSQFIEPEQVIQLDPKFEWCTPAFRAEMNQWLRDRFGVRDVAYMFGKSVFVNPRAAAKLLGDIRA